MSTPTEHELRLKMKRNNARLDDSGQDRVAECDTYSLTGGPTSQQACSSAGPVIIRALLNLGSEPQKRKLYLFDLSSYPSRDGKVQYGKPGFQTQ
jgi:hypothetical protein